MEVKGPGKTQGPAKTEKNKKTSQSSGAAGVFGALLEGASSTQGSEVSAGLTAVTGMSAILAAQSIDGDEARKANQIETKRGQDILDNLDGIRLGILTGSITGQRLVTLQKLLEQKRGDVDDPALIEIMDEIEVRAAVELAKFERDL